MIWLIFCCLAHTPCSLCCVLADPEASSIESAAIHDPCHWQRWGTSHQRPNNRHGIIGKEILILIRQVHVCVSISVTSIHRTLCYSRLESCCFFYNSKDILSWFSASLNPKRDSQECHVSVSPLLVTFWPVSVVRMRHISSVLCGIAWILGCFRLGMSSRRWILHYNAVWVERSWETRTVRQIIQGACSPPPRPTRDTYHKRKIINRWYLRLKKCSLFTISCHTQWRDALLLGISVDLSPQTDTP